MRQQRADLDGGFGEIGLSNDEAGFARLLTDRNRCGDGRP
jgi:hypothetical protein